MKKRGFTLIELLAVIVILAIVALIATPMVLNTIDEAKQGAAKASATSYIEAIENKVATSLIKNEKYEDKEDYVYDEIEVDIKGTKPTGGIYSLKNGIVTSGVFCIDGYEINYANNKTEVQGKCTGEELKLSGSVKLSESSGYYTYPTEGTFEVIENISGGILSCTSSDEEVATCSISGTTVTVTPGTKEGTATLTIKSEGSSKYKEAKAAYVVTTKKGLLSYTANGYDGVYDEKSHGIVVSSENSIITYGEEEGVYNLERSPMYEDVGEYTVYFQITKAGYNTITGSKIVKITKADGKIELDSISGTVEYNGQENVEIKENKSNGQINVVVENPNIVEASIVDNELNIIGKQTGTTTITLTSEATKNYNGAETQYTITVTKADNTLTLSSNTGNYTYPESGTFEVTENTSGGTLSCTSSDEKVAKCSIEGTTVTVTPGIKEGAATLTITSAATTNYNAGQVVYVAVTAKGTLTSYTAIGYSGTYDGAAHGITVQASGATVKYGTSSGSYTLDSSPTYTAAGTYTVYYEVTREGYNNVTGSKDVVITKASGSVTAPTAKTLTYIGSAQALINSGSTSTGTIQYKLGDGTYSTSIPTATNAGTYTVYYKVVGDSNHNDVAEASITVTIAKATLSYTANGYSGTYDGAAHGITVTSSGATIKYGTSNGSYTLTSSPTYTAAGTYTIYYQVTREGYNTVAGSKQVVISKASGSVTLSATSGTVYTGKTTTFTANGATGTLSCSTSSSSTATCSVSGTTVTVTGVNDGTATITVNVAESTNYTSTSKTYTATVKTLLSDVVSLGDYVSMTPTSTSYTVAASLTGYDSDQIINPSELSLWRVIAINSDGTIDMVSEYVSSTKVYFKGNTGYKNLVGALNTIAKQYENSNYTVGSRHMVYNGQTEYLTDTANTVDSTSTTAPWTAPTSDNSNEAQGGGDILYTTDTNLVTNALGTLVANNPSGTATTYWLASRYYIYNSSSIWYYRGRRVDASGGIGIISLYGYNRRFVTNSVSNAVRPIVTLKSGLFATGSGTSSSPWVLK